MKLNFVTPVSVNLMKKALFTYVSILSFTITSQAPANSQNNVYVIKNPKVNGYYLDVCLYWATDCGKPAADAYCQYEGYTESVKFITEKSHPTIVIGSEEICNEYYCGRIKQVNCIY